MTGPIYATARRPYGYNLTVHPLSGGRLQVHVDMGHAGHGVILSADETRDFIDAIAALQKEAPMT